MGDSSTPLGGMTVNPDGTIAYDFEGHIHAEGLDLTAGTSETPPADRKVRWLREADDAVVAELAAYKPSGALGAHSFHAAVPSNDGKKLSFVQIGSGMAGFLPARIRAWAAGDEGEANATLLNELGQSHFLQLVDLAKRKINAGSLTLEWPGGSPLTKTATVDHGLGVKPLAVVPGPSMVNACGISNLTNASFDIRMRTVDGSSPAGGTQHTVWWIAIG